MYYSLFINALYQNFQRTFYSYLQMKIEFNEAFITRQRNCLTKYLFRQEVKILLMFFLVFFVSMKKRNDQVSSSLLFFGGYHQTTAIYFLEILHELPRYLFYEFHKVLWQLICLLQYKYDKNQNYAQRSANNLSFIYSDKNKWNLFEIETLQICLAGWIIILNTRPGCYQ